MTSQDIIEILLFRRGVATLRGGNANIKYVHWGFNRSNSMPFLDQWCTVWEINSCLRGVYVSNDEI